MKHEIILKIKKYFPFINFGLCTLMLIFLFFIINKGFRFSDEGFYLMQLKPNQKALGQFTFFPDLIKLVLLKYSTNIIFLRILRLLSIVSIVFIMYKSSILLFEDYGYLMLSFLSLCLSYTFGPESFSYNSLNLFLLFLVYYLITKEINEKKSFNYLINILISFLIFLLIINKITTGVLCFMFLVIIYKMKYTWNVFLNKSIFIISILVLLFFVFNYILRFNFLESISNMAKTINYSKNGHNSSMVLNSIMEFIFQLKSGFLIGLVSFFLFFVLQTYAKKYFEFLSITYLLLLTILITIKNIQVSNSSFLFTLLVAWILFIFFYVKKNNTQNEIYKILIHDTNNFIILLMLSIFPLLGSLGTNVGLFRNMLMYQFFWISIIPFIFGRLQKNYSSVLSYMVYTTSISISLFVIIISTVWLYPFHLDDLKESKYRISNPYFKFDNIYISKEKYNHLNELKSTLDKFNFKSEDLIFGLNGNLGMIYFLKGKIPYGVPFSFDTLDLYFCSIKKANPEFYNVFFLFSNDEAESVIKKFKEYGYDINQAHKIYQNNDYYILYPDSN